MNALPIFERLAYERRRVKAVTEALSAVLQQGHAGDPAYLPFYLAVLQYLEPAMYRLHIQGVRLVGMIRDKLGEPDAGVGRVLCEVEQALADNQRYLARMAHIRERLEQEGAAELGCFEQTAPEFAGFLIANIGQHRQVWQLAQRFFSVDDWAYVAGITNGEVRDEQVRYERVSASVPPGLKLPGLV